MSSQYRPNGLRSGEQYLSKRLSGLGLRGDRKKPGLFGPHAATGRGGRIVVAQEVQDAMDQKESELMSNGMAMCLRLPSSGLDRYHHISKKMRNRRSRTLLLRKGQDVGGTIAVQVHSVKSPDGPIADEEYGNFTARSPQDG